MTSMHWFPAFGEQPVTAFGNDDPFSSSQELPPPIESSPSSSSSLFCSATEHFFTLSAPWPHAPWKMPSLSSGSNNQHPQVDYSAVAPGDYSWKLQRKEQPLSSHTTSTSRSIGSSSRRKHKRSDTTGGDYSYTRRLVGRPSPLHCRSRSDATAMTEASSSEEYYENNNNHNVNSGNSSSPSTAFSTGSELERAMWLVGMNNAAAQQYYNSQRNLTMLQHDYNETVAAEAAAAVEQAQRSLLLDDTAEPQPDVQEPADYLEQPQQQNEHQQRHEVVVTRSGTVIHTTTSPLFVETCLQDDEPASSNFDVGKSMDNFCTPSSLLRHPKRNSSNNAKPVYHRYRHVGDLRNNNNKHGDSAYSSLSPSAEVRYPHRTNSPVMSRHRKQDSLVLAKSQRRDSGTAIHGGTTARTSATSTTTPPLPLPSSPTKPLSKYKQHILKKHSFREEESSTVNKMMITNHQNNNHSPVSVMDRPTTLSRRSKSNPSPINLATVENYMHDPANNSNNIAAEAATTIATTTTPATVRAMAKLAAARRARTKSHDGSSSNSSSTASAASAASTTNNDDGGDMATTTTITTTPPSHPTAAARALELLSEILSPSNTMVVAPQYIDSDDLLLAVTTAKDANHRGDAASVHSHTRSIVSDTPTVRAGTFTSAVDRQAALSRSATPTRSLAAAAATIVSGGATSTSSSSRRRRLVISSISQPREDDDCDTSIGASSSMLATTLPSSSGGVATKAAAAAVSASNPVSIDECGPIDVDTGEEVDALIDSLNVISPLYDSSEVGLSKQDLLECRMEEQRFRHMEFPVLDEEDITRGLASYMRGFEPHMEDLNTLQQQQERNRRRGAGQRGDSAWLNDEFKDQYATTRGMDKYYDGEAAVFAAGKRRPSCMSAFTPKLLTSLMCVVSPQYQLHHNHSNHSCHGGSVDCQQQQQQQTTRQQQQPPGLPRSGGRTVFSISTNTGSALRSLSQESRLTFEI